MARLVTAHDKFHVHKTLGLLCLVHFAYRYTRPWPFAVPWYWIVAHVMLSSSSLIFRVPGRRIKSQPTTIWREYQLHAVLFTLRCAAVWAVPFGVARCLLVLVVHLLVDLVTGTFGEPGSTTVRGRHDRDKRPIVRAMVLVYGLYQHLALASHLAAGPENGLGFNALIAIQSSAFAMTLVRKGIWTWRHHAAFYTACIGLSAAYICSQLRGGQVALAVAAYGARRAGASKYLIWPVYAATQLPMAY